MRAVIGRLLQIENRDRDILWALLLQAVSCGIYVAVLDLVANTLFIEQFGAERIPLAFMISGGTGILLISMYNFFREKMEIHAFGMLNLILVMVVTAALLAGSGIWQRERVIFSVFVFMGPLTLLTLLGFWNTVRGVLEAGRGKRLPGVIEAGLFGGMVLAFFATPLLAGSGTGIFNLLYAGLAGLLVAAGSQTYLLLKRNKKRYTFSYPGPGTGPLAIFSHSYTGLMASYVVLGVAVSVMIHYSFLWASGNRFTGATELVTFFGFFFGSIMILAWTMKRYLFGRIKKRLGILFTLLVSPLLLMILALATAITAESYGYGGGAASFSYFFLLVILSKIMSRSLKESMEDPSMNIIYQTLGRREKHLVQKGIDGILHETGVFATGLFLACMVLVSFVEVVHVTYLLLMVLFIWIFVGIGLYMSYRRLLKVSLESDRLRETAERSLQDLAKADLEQTAFPVEMIVFNPYFFHYSSREDLLLLVRHSHPVVRELIWEHLLMSSPGLPDLAISQMMVSEKEPAVKERIRRLGQRRLKSKLGLQEAFIKERLDRFLDEKPEEKNDIGNAFRSGEKNEIYAALYQVAQERDRGYLPEVISLLRNQDTNLRSVAISTVALLESDGVGVQLVEFLVHPDLYITAWSALVRQGERVLDDLESAFYKPGADLLLQKRIISVMAAVGGPHAVQLLLGKLDYHHREIFHATVRSLYENHFNASEIQVATIQNAILRLVRTGTWNLAAKISIRTDEPDESIQKAIEDEIRDVNDLIMMLLAMICDRRSVQRIRMNLMDRDPENRVVAIEMMDLLVKAPLKTLLISYFEDSLVREKIDKLHLLFPVEIFPFSVLLTKILNRDGMQLGHFIRICVLDLMGRREEFFDEQQILAQGFHPDRKIRETAAQLLRKNDPERYNLVSERPDFSDNSFPDHEDPARWYIETVLVLSAWKLFMNVGLNALFKLVSGLQPFDEELLSAQDYVVLARSREEGDFSPLSSGIAIIAAHQPEILEQIRYLGAGGKSEAYLIEKEVFIELLFDDRSLLHVFCVPLNKNTINLV
jgi:AAA family ATP:ADP antiporter